MDWLRENIFFNISVCIFVFLNRLQAGSVKDVWFKIWIFIWCYLMLLILSKTLMEYHCHGNLIVFWTDPNVLSCCSNHLKTTFLQIILWKMPLILIDWFCLIKEIWCDNSQILLFIWWTEHKIFKGFQHFSVSYTCYIFNPIYFIYLK